MISQIPVPHYYYSDYQLWKGDWELIEGYPYPLNDVHIGTHQQLLGNFLYELEISLRKQSTKHFKCLLIPSVDWIISNIQL